MKMSTPNLKKRIPLIISIGLFVLIGGCIKKKDVIEPERIIFEEINPEEANSLIQNNKQNPDFIIIDVRTPAEYASGHIEGAINLDRYSETFESELNGLDKNKTYLVYCSSGNRSGQVFGMMKELGFMEVYNMLGGIIQWKAEGLPTVQ